MNRISPARSTQRARSSAEIPDAIADELRRYDEHMRDIRGLAADTRRHHCRFIARQLWERPSPSAAAQVATALRSHLRYRTV